MLELFVIWMIPSALVVTGVALCEMFPAISTMVLKLGCQ